MTKPISLNLSILFELIVFFVITFCLLNNPQNNYDIWWHLQVGKDIIENHSFPCCDTYSYTGFGNYWCVHSWLSDVIFFWIYQIVGYIGLRYFCISINLLIVSFFAWQAFRYSHHGMIALILSVIVATFFQDRETRPYIFSPFFFLLIIYLFVNCNRYKKKTLFLLSLILSAAWANLHGITYSISALLFFSSFIYFLKTLFQRKFLEEKDRLIRYGSICIAFFVGSTFNPNPISLFYRNLYAPNYPTIDWYPIYASDVYTFLAISKIVFFVLILITFIAILIFRERKLTQFFTLDVIISILCFCLCFTHKRLIWMLMLPLLVICRNVPYKVNCSLLKKHSFSYLLLYILFSSLFLFIDNDISRYSKMPDSSVHFLKREYQHANVYTNPIWSGYITFITNGKVKVFADTRIEPFWNNGIFWKALNYYRDIPAHIYEFRELGTTHILLPKFYPNLNELILNDNLKIIYTDDNSIILGLFGKINE